MYPHPVLPHERQNFLSSCFAMEDSRARVIYVDLVACCPDQRDYPMIVIDVDIRTITDGAKLLLAPAGTHMGSTILVSFRSRNSSSTLKNAPRIWPCCTGPVLCATLGGDQVMQLLHELLEQFNLGGRSPLPPHG